MSEQITINTYLELKAGAATLIEDVPVQLTVYGRDDGCGDLDWWIDEIRAEFIGEDLVMGCSEATSNNGYRAYLIEHQVMKQLYKTAEEDKSVQSDIEDQLYPLVFGRSAA